MKLLDQHPDDFAKSLRSLELYHHVGEGLGHRVLLFGIENTFNQLDVDEWHLLDPSIEVRSTGLIADTDDDLAGGVSMLDGTVSFSGRFKIEMTRIDAGHNVAS